MSEVKNLPTYRCHKLVRAAKIVDMTRPPGDNQPWTLHLDGGAERHVDNDWAVKHMRWDVGCLANGYFVEYADGYTSWSPAKVFEDGYTSIKELSSGGWSDAEELAMVLLCNAGPCPSLPPVDASRWRSLLSEWLAAYPRRPHPDTNVHGIGPDVGYGKNPDYQPQAPEHTATTENAEAVQAEYRALMHAVQSGVAMEIERKGPEHPKHVRTGINAAMVDSAALAGLLIKIGVITELEYFQALRDGARREKERYEKQLSEEMGANIKLH